MFLILTSSYEWKLYSVCLFVTGLFHLAQCPWGSSYCSTWGCSSLLVLHTIPLQVYTTFPLSYQLLMGSWVASSSWLVLLNATSNMSVHTFLQGLVLSSFRYILRSRIADHMVVLSFKFLRNLHHVFHNGYAITFLPLVHKGSNLAFWTILGHQSYWIQGFILLRWHRCCRISISSHPEPASKQTPCFFCSILTSNKLFN